MNDLDIQLELQLKQWLAYQQNQTAALDIRQAVQRELTGSAFSISAPPSDSQTFHFPITRIAISSLIRLGVGVFWFFINT